MSILTPGGKVDKNLFWVNLDSHSIERPCLTLKFNAMWKSILLPCKNCFNIFVQVQV